MAEQRADMAEERRFPIQAEWNHKDHLRYPALSIPWSVAEMAYRNYAARYGNGQSLETIAQRGGFGREELLRLLDGRRELL